MRIALVGAEGQLGAAVARECHAGHEVVEITHSMLDVTSDEAKRFAGGRMDAIVNRTALNDVAGAKIGRRRVEFNAFAVRALARAAAAWLSDRTIVPTPFDGTACQP